MHFHTPEDTIAAIATPPGEGAIAIVRLSGPQAIDIANTIFSGNVLRYASHTAHVGKILDKENNIVDEVLLLVMKNPSSYTKEDMVEIHCHGGRVVTRKIFHLLLENGAKSATPGEFTLRAFLNGKIDLAQAEAVQSFIASQNEISLHASSQQLQGALSKKISFFQKNLIDISSHLEAWIDFPEEELGEENLQQIIQTFDATCQQMQKLADTFYEGKIATDGISLCIVGSPNVGKSSLLNLLVGKNRAIVSERPGTTRDTIEETIQIGHLHFHLSDTAGIRTTDDSIEQEGIERSYLAIKNSDLILCVLDASRLLHQDDKDLIAKCPKDKTLFLWNKIDLCSPKESIDQETLCLSIKEGVGIEQLKEAIEKKVFKGLVPSKEEMILTKERHRDALLDAIERCQIAKISLLQKAPYECILFDLKKALEALNTIIGIDISEEILSSIFSKFCIGK